MASKPNRRRRGEGRARHTSRSESVDVGFPQSAMPAWLSLLNEQQRWEFVHYLRVLASGNP